MVYIDLFIWRSKKTQLSAHLSTTLTENYAKLKNKTFASKSKTQNKTAFQKFEEKSRKII